MASDCFRLHGVALLLDLQAFRAPSQFKAWSPIGVLTCDALSLMLLVLAFSLTDARTGHFPLPWSLLAVAATLVYIAVGTAPSRRLLPAATAARFPRLASALQLPLLNSLLSHPLPVYIGKLSYPLCASPRPHASTRTHPRACARAHTAATWTWPLAATWPLLHSPVPAADLCH